MEAVANVFHSFAIRKSIVCLIRVLTRPDVAPARGEGEGGLPGAGKPASGGETDFRLGVGATVSRGGLRHEAWSGLCGAVEWRGAVWKVSALDCGSKFGTALALLWRPGERWTQVVGRAGRKRRARR